MVGKKVQVQFHPKGSGDFVFGFRSSAKTQPVFRHNPVFPEALLEQLSQHFDREAPSTTGRRRDDLSVRPRTSVEHTRDVGCQSHGVYRSFLP